MTSDQQIVTHFFNATKNDLEDKNQFTLQNLKDFVKLKKYRNIGCKKDIIERVLWICNPNDYPKPDNIELKARGRPSTNNNSNTNNNTSNNTSNAIKNTIDIHTYKQAKCKEDLLQLKARELKDIIQSHKYRYVGSKKQLIDRVWWILHKDTEKPKDFELKSRGRPSFKNNYVVQFIDDDSEESINSSCDDDEGDYNEYIWTILFIQDGKINTENKGKKYFKFKFTTRSLLRLHCCSSGSPSRWTLRSARRSRRWSWRRWSRCTATTLSGWTIRRTRRRWGSSR
jgi:hypothetical protein